MGDRASINLNEYHVRGLLERDDLDLNKFYRADLIVFIETLRNDLKVSKSRTNKAIEWCDEIIRTYYKSNDQVVVAKEIKSILQGENTNVNITN